MKRPRVQWHMASSQPQGPHRAREDLRPKMSTQCGDATPLRCEQGGLTYGLRRHQSLMAQTQHHGSHGNSPNNAGKGEGRTRQTDM